MSSRETSSTRNAPKRRKADAAARKKDPPAEPSEAEAVVTPVEVRPALRRSDSAVEPLDALSLYMSQLAEHAPISREKEHALAVRWREEGDVEAARELVLANLRLVVKIAMEYRRAWNNVLDLIQEGNLGLMQAVQRFDPYKGVKLSSYGAYWIRAYILKYLIDNLRLVRLGRTRAERKLFFRLNKERRALEREGFSPEPRLLAERLDVSEEDVRSMEQRLSRPELSLNAPARRDQEGTAEYGDFIPAAGASAEETVGDEQMRRVFLDKVREFAETCDERERRILDERLLSDDPKTLQELGKEYGVSRERVRQLEARLMQRLSAYLEEQLVDFEFYATPRD